MEVKFPYTEAAKRSWIIDTEEDEIDQPISLTTFKRNEFIKCAKFSDEHDLKVIFDRPLATGTMEFTFHSDTGFTFLRFLDMVVVHLRGFFDGCEQYKLISHSIDDYYLESIEKRTDGKYMLHISS
jgi:hypothetical protein